MDRRMCSFSCRPAAAFLLSLDIICRPLSVLDLFHRILPSACLQQRQTGSDNERGLLPASIQRRGSTRLTCLFIVARPWRSPVCHSRDLIVFQGKQCEKSRELMTMHAIRAGCMVLFFLVRICISREDRLTYIMFVTFLYIPKLNHFGQTIYIKAT